MKYTKEITERLVDGYTNKKLSTFQLAQELSVPERSVISKLSSLGLYQRKKYTNKRGEVPIKKQVYIEKLAKLLNMDIDLLESLEKVNKHVLIALERALDPKSQQSGTANQLNQENQEIDMQESTETV